MRLHYVEICNFRSIREVRISFEPRCRTLVGINESGKSNILAALSLLDPTRKFHESDVRELDPDEDPNQPRHVRFVFRLDPSERAVVAAASKFRVFPAGEPLMQLEGKNLTIAGYASSVSEGLWRITAGEEEGRASYWALGSKYSILDGWLRPKSAGLSGEIVLVNGTKKNLKEISFIDKSQIDGTASEFFAPAEAAHVAAMVGEHVCALVKKNLPTCVYWTYSEKSLLPGQIDISSFEADPGSCEPLRQMFVLAGFSDPASAIASYRERSHGVRNLLERVANRATKHLRQVWGECGSIEISLTPNGNKIDASIKDAHNYYSIDRRSDGFKRFVSFLLLVSAKSRTNQLTNTLYLQDEPDLGLHPSGIKYLLKELVEMSRDNYVLVSTHSIFMVDKERIDRHIIVRKAHERTSVSDVGPSNITDEEVIYNALGYSLHNELRQNNIVFEGWRDKRLFKVFCQSATGKKQGFNKTLMQTGLCHAKGVKDVSRVMELLELHGKGGVVVSDGDAPAVEHQRKLRDARPDCTWMRYDELSDLKGKITAEDFVADAALHRAFVRVLSEHPALGSCPIAVFESTPVCESVNDWLVEAGASKDQKSELLNAWKSQVFENLQSKDIKPTYIDVVRSIFGQFD